MSRGVYFNAEYRQVKKVVNGKSGRVWGKGATRYAFTRENDVGERQERLGFNLEGDVDRAGVYEMLDHAAGNDKVYTFVLNPGEGRGDLSEEARQEWVRETIQALEDRMAARGHELKDWAAVSHVEQGEHDHVHVIGVTSHCLRKEDMPVMQELAREHYEEARELHQDLELDRLSPEVDKQLALELEEQHQRQRDYDWDY